MTQADGDPALLERIRRNEPGAFDEFVHRFGDRIYGFGLRVCGEREDAREVAQDTLMQAFRSLARLKDPSALRSWLYRVAANACMMKRRKGNYAVDRELSLEELMPRRDGGEVAEIPDPAALPDQSAARSELQREVREAIGDLPAHYRIVLVMRDMEQLTTRETAEALGLEESAVKMRLHRARLMVRKALESRRAPEEGP